MEPRLNTARPAIAYRLPSDGAAGVPASRARRWVVVRARFAPASETASREDELSVTLRPAAAFRRAAAEECELVSGAGPVARTLERHGVTTADGMAGLAWVPVPLASKGAAGNVPRLRDTFEARQQKAGEAR